MAARSEARAKAAIERLRAAGLGPGNGDVVWLKLDLGDSRSAKKAAESFMEKERRLDVVGMWPALPCSIEPHRDLGSSCAVAYAVNSAAL